MEELKRVQELRIDEFSRRRLIENQDTMRELTARIQELQNEVNCVNERMQRMNVKTQTQLWIRDTSQDRQPEIHSTIRREDFQRIMGPTNKDCRFRNFTLTNSLHQQHSLVRR